MIETNRLMDQVDAVSRALQALHETLHLNVGELDARASYQLGMARSAEGIAHKAVQQVRTAIGGMYPEDFMTR